jgi:hypothetical protein
VEILSKVELHLKLAENFEGRVEEAEYYMMCFSLSSSYWAL